MPTSKFWPMVIACVAVCATPLLVGAQRPATDVPPKLEKLEEGDAPAVTVRGSAAEREITETRERGRVTAVKVKSGNSTYYLKPNTPQGSAMPGDAQSDTTRAPQWQVLEFEWNHADPKKVAAQSASAPPPPGAAAAPAPTKNK